MEVLRLVPVQIGFVLAFCALFAIMLQLAYLRIRNFIPLIYGFTGAVLASGVMIVLYLVREALKATGTHSANHVQTLVAENIYNALQVMMVFATAGIILFFIGGIVILLHTNSNKPGVHE